MRLLLDENLSPWLKVSLSDVLPEPSMFGTLAFTLRKMKMFGATRRNTGSPSCPKILTFANAVSFSDTLRKLFGYASGTARRRMLRHCFEPTMRI